MANQGFNLARPQALTSSVVFASPHSGRDYTWAFLRRSALSELVIRSSEDAFVDQLVQSAPSLGAPLLTATVPRAFVDLNRSADELDPALIEGVQKVGHNPRVASGLGVIPRVVANGRTIYRGKLTMEEATGRLNDFWHPYHNQLATLLHEAHRAFGQSILVDFHSMPREALDAIDARKSTRPEIVIGDRFGASASPELVDEIEAAFASVGFKVARNTPFAGAYITQTYGRPARQQHAVQIEIDRSLYMNESALTPKESFGDVRDAVRDAMAAIVDIGHSKALPLAAE